MPMTAECPSPQRYEAMLRRGDTADRDTLLEHLERCSTCSDTVAPLLAGDRLLDGVVLEANPGSVEHVRRIVDGCADLSSLAVAAWDTPLEADHDRGVPSIPATIGHYRVTRPLGRGGMGAVFLATDIRLERDVALKVMLPKFAVDAAARERFLREARAAARISHDNVVTVYEADERDGVPFIAMQHLHGCTLEDCLRDGSVLPVPEVIRIATETAAGLAAAHALGLIHRDIKPANLWLEEPGGRVKVLDFGLAKTVDRSAADLSRNGALIGTPAYMSPEQARGKPLDARTDLFSLGAVMYRLATGRLPFDGPDTLAVLMALAAEEPPPVRTLNPAVPETVAALIHQMLAKQPDQRPPSAVAVMERLGMASPPVRINRGFIAAGFAAFALVLAGIVIIIRNKDGTETRIEVPDSATVMVKDDAGKTLAAVVSAKDSDWEKRVTAFKPAEQMAAVVARLRQLNPKFDGHGMSHREDNDAVVMVDVSDATELVNLSPFRALAGLKALHLSGQFRNPGDLAGLIGLKLTTLQLNGCPVTDLAPLKDMPLTTANLWGMKSTDLSPLAGMKLTEMNVGHSTVKDLSIFKGMPLARICVNYSAVEDLSPLAGAPIENFFCDHTKVSDLSPLANMPIVWLCVTGSPIKDYTPLRTLPKLARLELDYDPKQHRELLRAIPTLTMINGKPAAEVLNAK